MPQQHWTHKLWGWGIGGLLFWASAAGYWPQAADAQAFPTTRYQGARLPDFARITLNDLTLGESRSFSLGSDLRTFRAGRPLSESLRLGDYGGRFTGTLQTLGFTGEHRLSQVDVVRHLSLAELVQIAPALGRYQVGQIPLIRDLLRAHRLQVLPQTLIAQVVQYPRAGQLRLGSLNLNRYTLSSLPGLLETPVERFPHWQRLPLSRTPLAAVPLTQFTAVMARQSRGVVGPQATHAGDIESPLISMVDIIYGPAEQEAYRTATGGDLSPYSFHAPCYGQACPHFEVANCFLGNCVQFYDPRLVGGIEGRQIVNGRYHRVNGGFGPLGAVCGYQEPTGRFSYELFLGRQFKVVLTDQSEAEGWVQFSLYTQLCDPLLGCTGYCLGPIPLGAAGRYEEGDQFLM